jgi:hypothetical protein
LVGSITLAAKVSLLLLVPTRPLPQSNVRKIAYIICGE